MNLGVAMPAPGSEEIAPREIGEAREVYILIVSAADFSRDFLFSRVVMNLGVAMPAPGSEEVAPERLERRGEPSKYPL